MLDTIEKECTMYIDDTYLRRYIRNLCMKIKQRQSPSLHCLFRYKDDIGNTGDVRESDSYPSPYVTPYISPYISPHISPHISSDEPYESQRIRQLQSRYLGTITRFSMLVEMRDPLAAGHTVRLARYAVAVANALCWRREKVEELEIGAHLHDIGKVCITETILNKGEKLNTKEFRQIQRHARIGAGMLMKIDFLRPIIPHVLYHHERYDGTGYPFRLAGKDIPVEGRILAVVDTFDALINPRPYRKAMSRDMAIAELRRQTGRQLDPDVADLFIELLHKGAITV
ncbi:MAG: HD-GYP domain-containing protein [Nitrospirae bacterium]|nr:HD-GYP domain-containing protein [Nitrospirota bacterium]